MEDSEAAPTLSEIPPVTVLESPLASSAVPVPETEPPMTAAPASETVESSSAASEPESDVSPAAEDPLPSIETDAEASVPVGSSEPEEIPAAALDNKRKLEDLEQPSDGEGAGAPEEKQDCPAGETLAGSEVSKAPESVSAAADPASSSPVKRQRLDGESDGSVVTGDLGAPVVGNGQPPVVENEPPVPVDKVQPPDSSAYQQGNLCTEEQRHQAAVETSRKFEIPNNKVGVLIGKAGETIRVLQHNSGAKIQITRDFEANPNSSSRPVELLGTLESINKAEQLIKDVIAEAEAGGSPALVARGFGNAQSGSEQHEMQVPNEKVGWIIGKGGETIKNLQTRSGARIQLIPQHLPDGESPKERIVRVTGHKKQIEAAKEMIKEVMIQAPVKHAHPSGGYNQQNFRPRGPNSGTQWGTHTPAPAQQATGYDYQQRGKYPPQSTQYPPQSYGSYPQHVPPRSSTSAGWDPRAMVPVQAAGYNNYYGQAGQGTNIPSGAPPSAPVNYNYGPSQPAGYGQQTPYANSAPSQQSYNQGFAEHKYDSQAPGQQYYGQQPANSQPGPYPQPGATQMDYAQQQPYNSAQQSYVPPRAASDPMYQGSAPPSYGSGVPTQQSYPYGQTAPTQQAPAYGTTPGATDGYTQPPAAAVYPQQSSQVAPGYSQSGQPAPAYPQQGVQSGGYGQYPPQQGYADQSVPNNVNYGYQGGPAEAGYGGNNIPNTGYGSAPVSNQAGYGGQAGYAQPQSYPPGYEQSVAPQSGYGGHPGSVPTGQNKGVAPQPGYGAQYYSG